MKKFSFTINIILTSIALVFTAFKFIFNYNDSADISFLLFLGIYQVFISILLTIYAVIYNKILASFYLVYWFLVILFFKFIFRDFFYFCILIALYNLYVHYCSFSNSKYNITNYDSTI